MKREQWSGGLSSVIKSSRSHGNAHGAGTIGERAKPEERVVEVRFGKGPWKPVFRGSEVTVQAPYQELVYEMEQERPTAVRIVDGAGKVKQMRERD